MATRAQGLVRACEGAANRRQEVGAGYAEFITFVAVCARRQEVGAGYAELGRRTRATQAAWGYTGPRGRSLGPRA
jgi:hypothetical protein